MQLKVCSLFSGSSGNATYIGTENTHILVDAGLTGKKILESLNEIDVDGKKIDGILITHEHSDHIKSAGILSRKFNIPIYANEKTWCAMEKKLGNVATHNIRIFYGDCDFYIKDINVEPYKIPHDAADPVGFSFCCGSKKISITTDLGHTNSKIINSVMDSELIILEANHDINMVKTGPYPAMLKKRIIGSKGHLSNEAAGAALVDMIKGSVTHVLLAHLSMENNYPRLAWETVIGILKKNDIKVGRDIRVDMTYRDRISNCYQIEV